MACIHVLSSVLRGYLTDVRTDRGLLGQPVSWPLQSPLTSMNLIISEAPESDEVSGVRPLLQMWAASSKRIKMS